MKIGNRVTYPKDVEAAWGMIYPGPCQLCGAPIKQQPSGFVCVDCHNDIRPVEPPYCQCCGSPFAGEITGEFSCGNCLVLKPHFATARSAVFSAGPMRNAIHQFKYNQVRCLENFLCSLFLARALPELSGEAWAGVAPVPLHPVKERERGFNQSLPLAAALADGLSVPLIEDVARRVKFTDPQANLTREARMENMRGAFQVQAPLNASLGPVILIDDVMTTGATMSACAAAFRQAGASRVAAWTLARAGLGENLT